MPSEITATELREILDYCPDTGIFRWKVSRGAIKQGDVAGCRSDVRVLIGVNKRLYKAHRLAWLYMHGVYPPDVVDHIDGDPANNRIANLRLATVQQNTHNAKRARRDSQTGLIGVTQHKKSGLYRASIQYDGKRHSLGYYKTPEEAHAVYLAKKREVHEFNTL